jgi:hypothetical protein
MLKECAAGEMNLHHSKNHPFERTTAAWEPQTMKPFIATQGAVNLRLLSAVALTLISLRSFAASEPCEARSAATRVTVLELYTSEGCNSCPLADRWVSGLPAKGFTPHRVIPLAFHVDYWDQLGWPDRMAKAQFSARQRMHADRNRASVVYTPQLLLNGADYRSSFSDIRFGDRVNELNRLPAAADLLLRQRPVASGVEVELDMRLTQPAVAGGSRTYLAITENHLQSAISAGENRGKLLHHDFVVRELAGPLPMNEAGRLHWKSAMVLPPDWKRSDLSLVAFVQDARSGEILQALHAPLCARP